MRNPALCQHKVKKGDNSHNYWWILPQIVRALDKRDYLMILRDNFLLILHKNKCCDPSSELSHRDCSDEGSQHTVSMRNKKIILNYHQNTLLVYECHGARLMILLPFSGIHYDLL